MALRSTFLDSSAPSNIIYVRLFEHVLCLRIKEGDSIEIEMGDDLLAQMEYMVPLDASDQATGTCLLGRQALRTHWLRDLDG